MNRPTSSMESARVTHNPTFKATDRLPDFRRLFMCLIKTLTAGRRRARRALLRLQWPTLSRLDTPTASGRQDQASREKAR